HVLVEGVGNARGRAWQLTLLAARVLRLDALDPALELTDVVQVPLEPLMVVRSQLAPQVPDLLRDPVEDARVRATTSGPLLGGRAGAEQHLESHAGIPDEREGLGR